MSQTDQGHWREPPIDRIDPAYPPHLVTGRYEDTEVEEGLVIYDKENTDAWVCGFGMPIDSFL